MDFLNADQNDTIKAKKMISIVIPLLNEEESLQELFNRLASNIKQLKKDYEIIFVDDGFLI